MKIIQIDNAASAEVDFWLELSKIRVSRSEPKLRMSKEERLEAIDKLSQEVDGQLRLSEVRKLPGFKRKKTASVALRAWRERNG